MVDFTKELLIGIEHIDKQHETLIEYVNNLISIGSEAANQEEIEKSLAFLGTYVIKHFADEEAFQKMIGYPQYERHCKQHMDFIEVYRVFVDNYKKNGHSSKFVEIFKNTIVAWVAKHVMVEDKSIGKYYRKIKNKDG